jgi:hypothetical protein
MGSVPSLSEMWPQYPDGPKEDVATLVGGPIGDHITKDGWDSCCVRTSRALNYAGAPVDGFQKMKNRYMDSGNVRAAKGADGKWYIYSVYDMDIYLTNRFGPAKRFPGNATMESMAGVQGIIRFGFHHCTLWNGKDIRYNSEFGDPRIDEILVWPAPD